MKKDKGEVVSDFFVQMLTILVSFTLIFASIYYLKYTEMKNNISVAMRSTILQMEQIGYLDDSTKNQLQTRLQGLGMTGEAGTGAPEVTGTAEHAAESPKLFLTVKGRTPLTQMTNEVLTGDGWFRRILVPVNMSQYSVAVGYE